MVDTSLKNSIKTIYIEAAPETKPVWLTKMLYSIKIKDDLEKLNELNSLQSQVKTLRLQDKLGKQNFYEDMKKNIWTLY